MPVKSIKPAKEDRENPFQNIEDELAKQELLKAAFDKITKARVSLILDKSARGAFFAHLALHLKMHPMFGIGTAATDGTMIVYEPSWIVNDITAEQLVGVMVHEVMHCVLGHTTRRGGREPMKFNLAADCAINQLLLESGYELPSDCCVPGQGQEPFKSLPLGLTAEEYYDLLPDLKKCKKQGKGDGQDPGGCGGVKEPQDKAEAAEQESQWKINTAAAEMAAKQRGDVPAAIARLLGQIAESKVDWREQLREFLTRPHPVRNDWGRPNRRFLNQGLYLPTLSGERLGHVVVAIDTSGSIGERELAEFASEVMGIIGSSPTKLTVLWCDCKIGRVDEYDDISQHDLKLEPCGGGGTSHRPVFDWVEEQEEEPDVVVCLTDLYSEFPERHPTVPVLWVSTTKELSGPFGTTIYLK